MNNRKKINSTFLIIFLSLLFFFCFILKTNAAWIPGLDPDIETGLEEVSEMIKGTAIGALKQQGVNSLLSQVDNFAGQGSGGQPAFITNWQDFIIEKPKSEVDVYMNDYLSEVTQGRNTFSGYSTDGFTGPSNYAATLSQSVKSLNSAAPKLTYEGDPSQMFETGNFKNMELYLSGVNNPWAFNMNAENEQQKKLKEKEDVAKTIGTAYQGFLPASDSATENITSPGILAKEMMANAQDLPNKVLASAKTIPEVTAAVANLMIKNPNGFESVKRKVSKAASTENRANSSLNENIETNGPGARFGN